MSELTSQLTDRPYLPGMGKDWLLPVYDPLTRALGLRRAHRRLADQADVRPGHRVLEIGCGTGNLALMVKRRHPDAVVAGLDPDPKALDRAGRKAARAGLPVRFDRGFAGELPYPEASFDRVLSAFMFHHLAPAERRSALAEVRRVLVPGGELHLLDFGGGGHRHAGPLGLMARRSRRLQDNLGDRIPTLMREAGLLDPAQTGHGGAALGGYACYRAGR